MEREFLAWLRQRLPAHPRFPLGLSDDAALLTPRAGWQLVVTTDMLMEGVDFVSTRHDAQRIGRKSLAVNLSDLAAMGAVPVAAFISLALPPAGSLDLAQDVYEGLLPLAVEFEVCIAGGDTNRWDSGLVISVTALGEVEAGRALMRSGARPGDALLVTGEFGGSILGRHFDFTPRVREARWLVENAPVHAAMDVSDGLTLDLSRLAQASGCGAVIDLASVPISGAAHELAKQRSGLSALDCALGDGEDFELLLAVPEAQVARLLAAWPFPVPLTRIGAFVEPPGLWARDSAGAMVPLIPRGYEH